MKTIKLIHKLSELGRLVESWENPTMQGLEYFGWKCTETTSCHTPLYIKVNHQALTSNEIVLNDFEKAWNHEITQASFKAEVRKMARELINIAPHTGEIPRNADINIVAQYSFDALMHRLTINTLVGNSSEKYIQAICLKMGVELESEDKQ